MTMFQAIVTPLAFSSGRAKGMLFSEMQAKVQAWQAVHRSKSITMPHLAIGNLSGVLGVGGWGVEIRCLD